MKQSIYDTPTGILIQTSVNDFQYIYIITLTSLTPKKLHYSQNNSMDIKNS